MKKVFLGILLSLFWVFCTTQQYVIAQSKLPESGIRNNTLNLDKLAAKKNKPISDSCKNKMDSKLLDLLYADEIKPRLNSYITKSNLIKMKSFITAKDTVSKGLKASSDDLVYVYVNLNQGKNTKFIDQFANTIINCDESNNIASIWIEKGKLEKLASREEVKSIQIVTPPIVYSGSVTTEGDSLLQADVFRNSAGVDGTGIKIGVISNGVDHIADSIASGDLPAYLADPTANVVLSNNIGGDEGTAMLEIVHDIASGANLYFHDSGSDTLGFNSGY